MKRTAIAVGVLLSSEIALIQPAFAQAAEAPAQEQGAESKEAGGEIVVTAQRRVERIQEVPVGISLVSGEQLERQQVTQLTDLSRSTASLQFGAVGNSGSAGGGAFIRGIGTAALTRSAESAVGVVVDGVVQGNTSISNLFDIARVEVLRGPQGTLFGQSVSAGVINISTLAPDPSHFSGKVTGEFSSDGFAGSEFGRQVIRAGLNLPVSAESALRVSGYAAHTAGVLHNNFLKKDDNFKEVGIRGRYRGEFGAVTLNLIGEYNYNNLQDGGFFTLIGLRPDFPGPTYLPILAACGVKLHPGNMEHCSSFPERQRQNSYGLSGQVDIELGSLTLTSITAHRENKLLIAVDVDRTPTELKPFLNIDFRGPTRYRQTTQEVRLASDARNPFSFTLGGFYFDARTFDEAGPATGNLVTIRPPGAPFAIVESTITANHASSKNVSAFGEGRYHSGGFTAFLGARLTHAAQEMKGSRQDVSIAPFPGPKTAAFSNDTKFNDTNLSWRIGAQYEPSRNLMLYSTLSTGYKNAQPLPVLFLGSTAPVVVTDRVVLPEKPTAFEVGVKSTLLGGRLLVSVDGFYQETKNLQTQTFIQQSGQPFPSLLPGNVSKVVSKGIEADVFGRIGRNFTLNASAIYNVAKYPADYTDGLNVSLKGEQLAYAPRFAANVSGEYVQSLGGKTEGFLSLDARYKSKVRLSDAQLSPDFTVDHSRFIIGGRVGARVSNAWSIAVFASNLGASRLPSVLLPSLPPGRAGFYTTQSKRQVGLQASLEF